MQPQIARDLSYAHSARTLPGKLVIKTVENLTGRIQLIKRAQGYDRAVANGADFWHEMMARYGLHLDVMRGSLEDIPQTGPLVIIANHPYGVLDGLVMGHILSGLRGDFRILAHDVFRRAPDVSRVILPMDFSDTPDALRAAPNIFERVKLLLAAREMRMAREAALIVALEACSL